MCQNGMDRRKGNGNMKKKTVSGDEEGERDRVMRRVDGQWARETETGVLTLLIYALSPFVIVCRIQTGPHFAVSSFLLQLCNNKKNQFIWAVSMVASHSFYLQCCDHVLLTNCTLQNLEMTWLTMRAIAVQYMPQTSTKNHSRKQKKNHARRWPGRSISPKLPSTVGNREQIFCAPSSKGAPNLGGDGSKEVQKPPFSRSRGEREEIVLST